MYIVIIVVLIMWQHCVCCSERGVTGSAQQTTAGADDHRDVTVQVTRETITTCRWETRDAPCRTSTKANSRAVGWGVDRLCLRAEKRR